MSNFAHYSPFLKSKRGEAKACQKLAPAVQSELMPVFDVLAVPNEKKEPSKVQKHLELQVKHILEAWSEGHPCYVDLFDVELALRASGGVHPVTLVFTSLSQSKVNAIPVIGLDRDTPYKLAFRAALTLGFDSIAVRLQTEDLLIPGKLVAALQQLRSEVGANEKALHVLIDFRELHGSFDTDLLKYALAGISAANAVGATRIVVAGSSMIASMAEVERNSMKLFDRREFSLWKALLDQGYDNVKFGDYGTVSPSYSDLPFYITQNAAAKIRYATNTKWAIVKGRKWLDDTSQHAVLAAKLCAETFFRGPDCWGGKCIQKSAARTEEFKSHESWTAIGQNVHMTLTVQLVETAIAKSTVAQKTSIKVT